MDSTLKLAKDWAINNLIVEMDSSVAILFLKEGYSYNLNLNILIMIASYYGEALEDVRSSIASGKLKLFSQVGYRS